MHNTRNFYHPILLMTLALGLLLNACDALRPLSDVPSRPSSATTPKDGSLATAEARTRSQIITEARQYLGSPYKYAGRDPRSGFDCSGFTRYVLSEFGVDLAASSRTQVSNGRPKPIDEVQPGDLVFFRRSSREPIFHVALVIKNDRDGIQVIHSTSSRGVVIDNITQSTYWAPKLSEARDVLSGR